MKQQPLAHEKLSGHMRESRALMSLAHAALIAKREGLLDKKFESLGREDM